ncbi:putative membrane-anchored protein [Fluviicoccus keumensis]|uniref:Putative membrane-anchored protein n=1 Tax=Fluviicoccus keumensis TaxID=1435465 RepID=A0A4Q7Z9Q3_9GAMM|nr:DUF3422 domain-containing protein [Fluviicoccus keumensis]RZU46791.1 putative membrane-anchored protein [Fluviicoccus keumensis]
MTVYVPPAPNAPRNEIPSVRMETGSLLLPIHPERDRLFNELHTRPFPVLEQGSRVSQVALLHGGRDVSAEYAHIRILCERYSILPPSPGSSCYYQNFGGFELRWERHTEFSTYTFIHRVDGPEPFQRTGLSLLPPGWLAELPGEVISGLHIEIHAMPEPEPVADVLRHYFEGQRLVSSWVIDKKARLWTAYRIHNDGLGRILVLNKGLNPCQLGRLVRRLLELETYRMMVLLAFPMARSIAPEVAGMDSQLAVINEQINAIRGLDDERRLLGQLSTLAARIEHLRSETNFRFSAARAYYELVLSRLEELREQEEPGMQTFNEFLPRRLTPAFRTCEAVSGQLDNLSKRIDRASELLRTRVDLTLEAQNQDLLQSMNQRSQMQLQLQQAVEGLSVVAISYYLVGLVKYMAGSLAEMGWLSHPELVVGLSVPVCAGLVWRGVHRLRKGLQG